MSFDTLVVQSDLIIRLSLKMLNYEFIQQFHIVIVSSVRGLREQALI